MKRCCLWLVLFVLAAAGCGSRATVPAKPPEHAEPLQVIALSDAQVGHAIATLIANAEVPNRLGLLAGVVERQLARAERLLQAGQEQAGLAALSGALFLINGGEFRVEMIRARHPALLEAAHAAARSGNEGRAIALYSMLNAVLTPGAVQNAVTGHLTALEQWRSTVTARGGVQALGARQRALVPQVTYQPSAVNYKNAREATLRWFDAARRYGDEHRAPPQSYAELDEREEADFARQVSVPTLAVLALRYGDFAGLLETLEEPSVAPNVRPQFVDLLRAAIEDNDPAAWAALLDEVDALASERSELGELARASTFRVATLLYQADPQAVRAIVPVSGLLIGHGMADAVPSLLERSAKGGKDPRVTALALRLTAQALIGLESINDLQTARLTYANAKPLLQRAVAGSEDEKGSLGTLEHVMGAMEVRAAELTRARPHLVQAVSIEPTVDALRLLAAVDRQQGRTDEAEQTLLRMAKQAGARALTLAESHLLRYELLCENPASGAQSLVALQQALRAALKARSELGTGAGQPTAERLLARILEHYGDRAGARRASDRAVEGARNDPGALASTILDFARRSFTFADLEGAQAAVQLALDEHLDNEDTAYAAVWLVMLQKQLKRPIEGNATHALQGAARGQGWVATLSRWALGKLSDSELQQAAKHEVERVEAIFYLALAARVAGDQNAATVGLRQVAASEAIELVEVTLARDLLGQLGKRPVPALPRDISVP